MNRKKAIQTLIGLAIIMGPYVYAQSFTPPDQAARSAAVGNLSRVNPALQRIYEADASFGAIPTPGPLDWLSSQHEQGQTVDQYIRSQPNRPNAERKVLYIQPIGPFPDDKAQTLASVHAYARIFFSLEVKLLAPVALSPRLTQRVNDHTQKPQILTGDVLDALRAKLPKDAYCMIGVTMTDLYPAEAWNFVFGQASLRNRVAIYSFARYDPVFWGEEQNEQSDTRFLRRCLQVFAHETGHMFGIRHCIYYHCLMNGSNSMRESDAAPLHACPVCLRKLSYNLRFNPIERYKKLSAFYRTHGLEDAAFIDQLLAE